MRPAIGFALGAWLFTAIGLATAGGAAAAGGSYAGRVDAGAIESARLGRAIAYRIYLPNAPRSRPDVPASRTGPRQPVLAKGSGGPLPVLYLLHGMGDDETAWLRQGRIQETLDRLIGTGRLPAVAVVMPRAGNSWYVDDVRGAIGEGHNGPYFSALMSDFISGVERRYPVGGCRGRRAIGGLSMGGYGAVLAGLTYPGRFAAVISLSGSLFVADRASFARRADLYARIFQGVFGVPVDYARFRDWNVFERLAARPAAGRVPAFFLSAGDDDFRAILSGTVRFHAAVRRRGGESELRVIDGRHDWANWSREIADALSWLGPRLGGICDRGTATTAQRTGGGCGSATC